MDCSSIIKLILNDFKSSFNISVEIKYDSKENIMKYNSKFKVSNNAAGFYDTKSKTIYFFQKLLKKSEKKTMIINNMKMTMD